MASAISSSTSLFASLQGLQTTALADLDRLPPRIENSTELLLVHNKLNVYRAQAIEIKRQGLALPTSDPKRAELLDKVQRIINGVMLLHQSLLPLNCLDAYDYPYHYPAALPQRAVALATTLLRFEPVYRGKKPVPESPKITQWRYGPYVDYVKREGMRYYAQTYTYAQSEAAFHHAAARDSSTALPISWSTATFIATPKMKGSLRDSLLAKIPLRGEPLKPIILGLVNTLVDLQRRYIIHADFKWDNLVCDERGKIFLMDFGLAIFPGECLQAGTAYIVAPEVFTEVKATYARDVWSLGMVIWRICTNTKMFPIDERGKDGKRIRAEYREIIIRVTQEQINAKIDADVREPALNSLLKAMLTVDPTKRIKIEEVLSHPYFRDTVGATASVARAGAGAGASASPP